MSNLTWKEIQKYSRQIIINDFGIRSQEKLKKARVLVAGAGGLGSTVITCLAAAGIGCLKIIDDDAVELSNLNRQFLHYESDVGEKKIKSIAEKISRLNPDITIEGIPQKITKKNAEEVTAGVDLIIDCLDNFKSRFILNWISRKRGVPLVFGSVNAFEGMATFLNPGRTPCLECFVPNGISDIKSPVIGVTPALIGAIQATEAIKYITGMQASLENKLLLYDGRLLDFELIGINRNPECPCCGKGGNCR